MPGALYSIVGLGRFKLLAKNFRGPLAVLLTTLPTAGEESVALSRGGLALGYADTFSGAMARRGEYVFQSKPIQ